MTPMMPARRAPFLMKSLLLIALLMLAGAAQAEEKSGYLGVQLQDLKPAMRTALQMDDEDGVLVSEVVDDTPAAKAGLKDGDVILKYGDAAIEDSGDLSAAVRKTEPGQKVELTILRGGKKKTIDVEIGEMDDEFTWTVPHLKMMKDGEGPHGYRFFHGDDGDIEIITDGDADVFFDDDVAFFPARDHGYLGIHLDDLNEQLGKYFEVDGGEGVLVTEVVEDSPAAKAGLQAGDVIVELDGKTIASTSDLHETMADTDPEQKVKVKVLRKGDDKSFDVTLGEMPERNFFSMNKGMHENLGKGNHFQVRAPRMRMERIERDGLPQQRRIIIEKQSEDMEQLRSDMKALKEELKKLKEELKN